MTSHTILLADAQPATHLGHPAMDDDQFRKLSQEKARPVQPGASLFRHAAPAPAETAAPVPNLPVLSFRHNDLTPAKVWESLVPVTLDAPWLEGNGLFPNSSTDPAPAADAERALRRAASKGIVPKGRASRLVSRLHKAAARAKK